MKVIHLSRFDGGDGASNAVYRLHRALRSLGIDSTMFVGEMRSEADDPTVKLFHPSRDLGDRIRRRLRRGRIARSLARYRRVRPSGYEAFSDDRSPHGSDLPAQLPAADVINVHAMYQFVEYQAFFATVPQRTPVVRTLHDMNFFTGGCHIAAGCTKYVERCGACPQLGSQDAHDLSRQIWQRKRTALRRVPSGRLHVVAPSRWLAGEAMRSSLLQDVPVSVIPFGVDTEVFHPRDRRCARDTLGISTQTRVVLFVAEPISRPVKRFHVLAEALNGLVDLPHLLCVSVGSGKPPAELRVPYLNVGRVGSERLLSLVYSAGDVLVLPSLQENLPLVVLEAMACGLPVVGSDVGGIPDMVRPGVTGRLFPVHDVQALRATIRTVLEDEPGRGAMAANCRRIATEEYSLESHARRYADLYQTLVTSATAPRPLMPTGLAEGRNLPVAPGRELPV